MMCSLQVIFRNATFGDALPSLGYYLRNVVLKLFPFCFCGEILSDRNLEIQTLFSHIFTCLQNWNKVSISKMGDTNKIQLNISVIAFKK